MLQDKETAEFIHVFSTHLDSNGVVAREEGMKLVLDKMSKVHQGDTIFMLGDLNISPFIYPYELARTKYNDAYLLAGKVYQKMPNTYNGFNQNIEPTEHFRGDMIFTNSKNVELYINDFDCKASDHNLIFIKV